MLKCFITCMCLMVATHMKVRAEDSVLKKLSIRQMQSSSVILWNVGERRLAIPYPFSSVVAKKADSSLALGFTHMGYTANDPDGKSATLTVTVKLNSVGLSEADKKSIESEGFVFSNEARVSLPAPVLVDLRLPSDTKEEERLRKSAGLPKSYSPGSNLPLTFQWDGVAGDTLYSWLTDKADGLKIVFSYEAGSYAIPCELVVQEGPIYIDEATFRKWKTANHSSEIIKWIGGNESLVADLLVAGVFVQDGRSLSPEKYEKIQSAILPKFAKFSVVDRNGIYNCKASDVEAIKLEGVNGRLVGKCSGLPNLLPGEFLLTNPDYVTDLTSGKPGLDAIKP